MSYVNAIIASIYYDGANILQNINNNINKLLISDFKIPSPPQWLTSDNAPNQVQTVIIHRASGVIQYRQPMYRVGPMANECKFQYKDWSDTEFASLNTIHYCVTCRVPLGDSILVINNKTICMLCSEWVVGEMDEDEYITIIPQTQIEVMASIPQYAIMAKIISGRATIINNVPNTYMATFNDGEQIILSDNDDGSYPELSCPEIRKLNTYLYKVNIVERD